LISDELLGNGEELVTAAVDDAVGCGALHFDFLLRLNPSRVLDRVDSEAKLDENLEDYDNHRHRWLAADRQSSKDEAGQAKEAGQAHHQEGVVVEPGFLIDVGGCVIRKHLVHVLT